MPETPVTAATSEESFFDFPEFLFSRTDPRGVIEAGNSVFQRVSEFDWDKLKGAPHKIIRHPEMPTGVFWLFWKTLERRAHIGAYVLNRSKTGKPYWVFAIASPVPDGFISVRIKPSTDHFKRVKEIYAKLLAAEKEEGLSPIQSGRRLLSYIRDLGFRDYKSFQARALTEELAAIDTHCGRPKDQVLGNFAELSEAIEGFNQEAERVVATFTRLSTVPWNLRLIASRIEPEGGPITAISANYASSAREVSEIVQSFSTEGSGSVQRTQRAVIRAEFLTGVARIQREVEEAVSRESQAAVHVDREKECGILRAQTEHYIALSREAVGNVAEIARDMSQSMDTLKRLVMALTSTASVCRVESARINNSGGNLHAVVDNLNQYQSVAAKHLDEFTALNATVQARAAALAERLASKDKLHRNAI